MSANGPTGAAKRFPALVDTPLDGDRLGVTIHRLSNGMTVYISPNPAEPQIFSQIVVRAGSRNDPADSTGLAHYLEHMLFKGSRKLGTLNYEEEKGHLAKIEELYRQLRQTREIAQRELILAQIDKATQDSAEHAIANEFDQLYAYLGITGVNAYTSDDVTAYMATVPVNQFETWADVEADRFASPVFRLFYPELEAVYEEKNSSLDSPGSRVYEALRRQLFPNHPYGTQTTIGTIEHLKNPAFDDMVEFYKRWYRPDNMAIVLAGDISPSKALPVLEKYFGAWNPGKVKPLTWQPPTPAKGRRHVKIEAKGENSVHLAWTTAAATHRDAETLEVMDLLIDNATTGLLNVDLLLTEKLPAGGSYGRHMREGGFWTIRGTAKDSQSHKDVEELLLSVVKKLKKGAFASKDVDAVVSNLLIDQAYDQESNYKRGSLLVDAFINQQEWSDIAARPKRLEALTKEDIVRVAHKYLTSHYVSIHRVRGEHSPPKVPKPKITPVKIDTKRLSDYARSFKQRPATPIEPKWLEEDKDYEILATNGGGKLFWTKNILNDLFSMSYSFDVGSQAIPILCVALDIHEGAGTANYSAEKFRKELYALGGKIDTDCSEREVTVTLSGPTRTFSEVQALAGAWFRSPVLDKGQVKAKVENMISRRRDFKRGRSSTGPALWQYAVRGKESHYVNVFSDEQLQGLASDAGISRLRRAITSLTHMVHDTTYFGPLSSKQVKASAPFSDASRKTPNYKPWTYRSIKKAQVFVTETDASQASVWISYPNKRLTDPEIPAATLLEEYLSGGMGALLFQEVREARGLAYSVWASHDWGERKRDQSLFQVGLRTQVDKSLGAITLVDSLTKARPLDLARFQLAKKSWETAARAQRILPRRVPSAVLYWSRQGYQKDPRAARWKRTLALERQEVEDFAKSITSGPAIYTITVDPNRVKPAAFRPFGEVKVVEKSRLFGY